MGNDSINRKIYIRTDGNQAIATGHFTRCLSIAAALHNIEILPCFIVSDEESHKLLAKLHDSLFSDTFFPLNTHILKTAYYDKPEQELDELYSFFNNTDPTADNNRKCVLLLDSYFVTENYLSTMRKICKIAYIDDLRSFDYPVDLLINYDIIPEKLMNDYLKAYKNSGKLLLGAAYTPLRPQFQDKKSSPVHPVRDILLTSGGSDPLNFIPMIAEKLISEFTSFNIHIVVGTLFQNIDILEALSRKNDRIILHYHVTDMASLMLTCDLAVSAAGTTLYELCALALPAISFSMAENQISMAEIFDELNAVFYAGNIVGNSPSVCQNICMYINNFLSERDLLKKQQQHMSSLIDGKGASRIAHALSRLCNISNISLES